MNKEFLKRNEVAKIFGIHNNTLTAWKKRNVLVPVTIGGLDFYRSSDIQRLNDRRQEEPEITPKEQPVKLEPATLEHPSEQGHVYRNSVCIARCCEDVDQFIDEE